MNKKELKKLFENFGFKYFEKGLYNLNLFGVRSKNSSPNYFDDIICVACETEDGWKTWAFPMTSDPGLPVLGNVKMGNGNGTAMLPSSTVSRNQYKFKIGEHKGLYPALVQKEEFILVRDNDKNNLLLKPDEIKEKINKGNYFKGFFGINIHHASNKGYSKFVGDWSWGCQVFQSIFDWNLFWSLIKRSSESFGINFTYTLFDERDLLKIYNKNIIEFYNEMNNLKINFQ